MSALTVLRVLCSCVVCVCILLSAINLIELTVCEVLPEASLQCLVHAVLLGLDEAAHQLPVWREIARVIRGPVCCVCSCVHLYAHVCAACVCMRKASAAEYQVRKCCDSDQRSRATCEHASETTTQYSTHLIAMLMSSSLTYSRRCMRACASLMRMRDSK